MPAAVLDDEAEFVATPTHVRTRVKGSWKFFYGADSYDFEDWRDTGKTFDLPKEVADYLAANGNTYERYSD